MVNLTKDEKVLMVRMAVWASEGPMNSKEDRELAKEIAIKLLMDLRVNHGISLERSNELLQAW